MGTYAVVVGIQTVSRFPLKYSTKQNKTSKITGKKRKKKPHTETETTQYRDFLKPQLFLSRHTVIDLKSI